MTDPYTSSNTPRNPEPDAAAPQFGLGDQLAYQRYQQKGNKVLWGIFALLLVLAVGVFFILPNYVAAPTAAKLSAEAEPATTQASSTAAMSPFEEAQVLRQRETAQNALAALLALQETMEAKDVKRWAAEAYADVIDVATQGDTAYREQRFIDAAGLYQKGADILQDLDATMEQRYVDLIAAGTAALARDAAAEAATAFDNALLMQPAGTEALSGKERAAVLNDVLTLLEQGRAQHERGELDAAKSSYQQALALDSAHNNATAALQQVNLDIAQRAYADAMSRGYAALQKDDPEAAELAFRDALTMRPDAEEVQVALQQAADQISGTRINRYMEAALAFETNEEWSSALEQWEAALKVDPNLVVADRGKRRTETRLELDLFFTKVIAKPLELVAEDIHAQTRQLLIDIRQISNQGPRLREQVVAVEALMANARVPVTLTVQSDGLTRVTIRRVSELGLFTSTSLELLPGEYVAVGVRDGYRDARVEFTVNIGTQAPAVTVACSEKI